MVGGTSPTSSCQNFEVFKDQALLFCLRISHLLLLVPSREENGPEVWVVNLSSAGINPDPSPGPACVGMTPGTAQDAGLMTPCWSELPLLLPLEPEAEIPH